jgi:hypothetical protein
MNFSTNKHNQMWTMLLLCFFVVLILLVLAVGSYLGYCRSQEEARVAADRPRVVFTLTTLPSRIDRTHETVRQLLESAVRADKVYLHVPDFSVRDQRSYVIPPALQALQAEYPDRFVINRCADLGPLTKLWPVLALESDPDTILLTADCDIAYPRRYHTELVEASVHEPRVAFGYRGVRFGADGTPAYVAGETGRVDVLEGFTGVAYRRGFFADPALLPPPTSDSPCFFTDDIFISGCLARARIPRRLLPNEPHHKGMGRKGMPVRQRDTAHNNPLHVANHQGRNRACYQQLSAQFKM